MPRLLRGRREEKEREEKKKKNLNKYNSRLSFIRKSTIVNWKKPSSLEGLLER
jgi:hypothetical protein